MEKRNLSYDSLPDAISEILALMQKFETLIGAKPTEKTQVDPEPLIYGINGLAKFLQVSTPTAQKIKNSGKIPYSQAERTIIFRKTDVLEALSNTKKKK
jgi:hypothetical protein